MIQKIKEFLFHNKNTAQTVAKNTFWLFFGQVISKSLRAALIIFAARILGPASWGAFSYVMGLVAFILILSDIGMTAIVTRESSKDIELSKRYFSTAFFIKILLLAIGVAILIWLAPYFTKINEAKILLPIAAFMLIFDSLRNFSFAQSRAREKMQLESFNEIITNIIITGLGFYFLKFYPGSKGLTIAYAIGTTVGFFAIILSIKYHLKNLWANFDRSLIKTILSASLPFALASFLGAIMINTDLIMLSWMRSPDELGFYSAAQKPIQLLYVMANLFAAAMFPVLSKAVLNKERFKNLLEKSLSASLLVALPLSISGILLAKQIIVFLFGSIYTPAVLAFQILMVTLLIIFPSVIISNSILAYNKQKNFIIFSALGALGNVFFNFLLIPYWGIAGAATSTIFTMIISNAFIWIKMKSLNDFKILRRIKKIIISTILIIPVIILLKYFGVNLIINIVFTTTAYFTLLKIQKEETVTDLFKKISAGQNLNKY